MSIKHIYHVVWGTGTPKDRDEVKWREVWECEGWVCDLECIGCPSIFKLIRSAPSLVRMYHTLDLICEENVTWKKRSSWLDQCVNWTPEVAESGQFPDDPPKIEDTQRLVSKEVRVLWTLNKYTCTECVSPPFHTLLTQSVWTFRLFSSEYGDSLWDWEGKFLNT
jgi:hypothetical protein